MNVKRDRRSTTSAPWWTASASDPTLVVLTGLLLTVGLWVVFSSSAMVAFRDYGSSVHFLYRQTQWALLALVAGWGVTRIPLARWQTLGPWILVLGAVLGLASLLPGFGHEAGGQRRWIRFGAVGLQPSELSKLGLVVTLAWLLARGHRGDATRSPRALLGPLIVAQIPILIVLSADFGTALVMEAVVATMVFLAGLRLRTLMWAGLAALPLFYHLMVGTPFRLQRLLGYLDPWAYRSTVGYQVTEGLIAIGSGGVWGAGLGENTHSLFFLPEAHNDFIFAILASETGLVGVTCFIVAFAWLGQRGFFAVRQAPTMFHAYLAMGLTATVLVPAVFNMSVATGLVPTKGLSLPLISYGGSNLVVTVICIAMLSRAVAEAKSPSTSRAAEEGQ